MKNFIKPQSNIPKSLSTLNGIQALRLMAATMVVLLHSTFYISTRVNPLYPVWSPGYYGVHIFFVISGFVMILSSQTNSQRQMNWMNFATQRLIRIVPLYWLVNIIKLLIFEIFPSHIRINSSPFHILLSMFFVPARSDVGILEPFYGVGWTLNFEMMFYFLFTLALWRRKNPLYWITPVLIGLAIISLFKTQHWPSISFYCDPIVLNFIWGMLIATLYNKPIILNVRLAICFFLFGFITIVYIPNAPFLGLQYASLVLGTVYIEPYIGHRIPKWVIRGGTTSYALYLLHPMIGPAVTTVVASYISVQPIVIISTIILSSSIVSMIANSWFESPVTIWLKQLAKGSQNI